MHPQTIEQIQQLFSCLRHRLYLLDMNGNSVLPGLPFPYPLPMRVPEGRLTVYEGIVYLPVPHRGGILAAEEGTPEDVLRLAAGTVDALLANTGSRGIIGVYQQLLLNDMEDAARDTLISEYHIALHVVRCVVLLNVREMHGENAFELLRELIPLMEGDVLLPLDSNSAALIRPVSGQTNYAELTEFCQAVQETVLQETARPLQIGMGDFAQTAQELRTSYCQAKQALEIGRVFHPEKNMFVYHTLLRERFLWALKPEEAAYYHALLFNRHTARLFNEEMLGTIEMFFEKDLNLSETARKLFIHRNTLVYRLDKIQQQTGLDLRRFDDAVTFKILLEMKKRLSGSAKHNNAS